MILYYLGPDAIKRVGERMRRGEMDENGGTKSSVVTSLSYEANDSGSNLGNAPFVSNEIFQLPSN